MTHVVFNPPPGWPPPPPGWIPPVGWLAPAEWPAPPADWVMFLESPSRALDRHRHAPGSEGSPPSWWGEGGGYHAAYLATPGPAGAAGSRPPRPQPFRNRAPRVPESSWLRARWAKRSALAAAVVICLGLFATVANSPVARAIALCESGVVEEAGNREASPDAAEAVAPGVATAAGAARPEVRYVMSTSGSEDVVSIAGDYVSTSGVWYTFTCSARHNTATPAIVELSLSPVVSPEPVRIDP